MLAFAFVLVAALVPLALALAALHPCPCALALGALAGPALVALATPSVDGAAVVALVLLAALAADVARVLLVKRRAETFDRLDLRGARLSSSSRVDSPTAIGYLHPAIVVPRDFRERVDAGEWDAVLAHERAHLARGDDWAKALQSALVRLGWWLPGLWILAGALDLEREVASDERAVPAASARRYAACLLRLATERGGDLAPALSGRPSQLAVRVERLLRPATGAAPPIRIAAPAVFCASVAAALVAVAVVVPSPVTTAPVVAKRPAALHHAVAAATEDGGASLRGGGPSGPLLWIRFPGTSEP